MLTSRKRVVLKFPEREQRPVMLKRSMGRGFSAERVLIQHNVPFDYKWRGPAHYLAVHDLDLADGETFLNGGLSSRLRDLGGKLTFIPSGNLVSGWSAPKKRANAFTAIYFQPEEMSGELAEDFGSAELRPSVYFDDPALRSTLYKITALLSQRGPHDDIYAESLAVVAAVELLRLQKVTPKQAAVPRGKLSVRQQTILRDYIEDYLHTDIALSDLAAVTGLTRFHFARVFAATFGEPPHRYVSRRRVEYARQLLSESNLAVSEIAEKVGLKNRTLLSRQMRKFVGASPRDFRRRLDP